MLTQGNNRPINTVKSIRPDEWRGLTSCKAGVIVPIAFFPLLREDRLRGRITVQVKSEETVKVIVNPVRVRVEAHLIPKTMLERFGGSIEVLNRSYQNEPAPAGLGTTPKWFLASPALPAGDTGHAIYDTLGLHWADGAVFNSDLVESYNQLVNWQRQTVSPALTKRTLNDTTLAQAMWDAWRFDWIKPSFDAGMMEGSVPLALQGQLAVPISRSGAATAANAAASMQMADDGALLNTPGGNNLFLEVAPNSGMMVDLASSTGIISLANIRSAEQTQMFAMMRDRYKNVPAEYLIDLMMAGISIPESELRQPLLLASGEAMIGQTERYATDGTALDVSVANGMASLSMTLNCPQVNSGGMVLVTMSIVPEQLFERVQDPALLYGDGSIDDVATPQYLKDYLDPQKVEVTPNSYVDVRHGDPTGAFGYAPLNYRWRRWSARVGGKYKRPVPDAFLEDRQRIWSIEKTDPSLSEDWYLCPSPFPHTVFADTDADPYEVITVASCQVIGNTVFGPRFDEDMDSWDKIIAEVDQTRLSGDAVSTLDTVDDAQVVSAPQPKGDDE